MKTVRIDQETIVNSEARYTTPVFVPPFSFNAPTPGLETPVWSPPYDIVLTNAVMVGAQFEVPPGGSTVMSIRKWNDLTPYDEPIVVSSLTLASASKRVSADYTSSYTLDLRVSSYDNLYCSIVSGETHAHLTVQLYAYRDDGV